jgi:hypothetical protein
LIAIRGAAAPAAARLPLRGRCRGHCFSDKRPRPARLVDASASGCREVEDRFLVGATIAAIDPDSRLRLMEWCYVVCSRERLRGHRPFAPPVPESEAIVVSLDDYRETVITTEPATLPATAQ